MPLSILPEPTVKNSEPEGIVQGSHKLFYAVDPDGQAACHPVLDSSCQGFDPWWELLVHICTEDDIIGDPLFLDTSGDLSRETLTLEGWDFRVSDASPALDNGMDLSAFIAADITGASRPHGSGFNRGAYEMQE